MGSLQLGNAAFLLPSHGMRYSTRYEHDASIRGRPTMLQLRAMVSLRFYKAL